MKITKGAFIVITFGLSLLFILSPSLKANALESEVQYDGKANQFIILDESMDLFNNFKGVMPGDKLTQQIKIINNTKKGDHVEIFLHAESPDIEYKEFIKQLNLTVMQNGKMIVSPDESINLNGLEENVIIASFVAPGETILEVMLEVPLEMGNEFKDTKGTINWVFSAVQTPKKQVESPVEEQPETGNLPKTGTTTNALYIVTGLLFILVGKTLFGERKNHTSRTKKN